MSSPSAPQMRARPLSTSSAPMTNVPSSASREKIKAEAREGWGPLRISKRPGIDSPSTRERDSYLSDSVGMTPPGDRGVSRVGDGEMRRTSSSYKHLKTNSLVSNSPFKSLASDPHAKPLTPSSAQSAKRHSIGLGLGLGSPSPAAVRSLPPTRPTVPTSVATDVLDRRSRSADGEQRRGSEEPASSSVGVAITGEESSGDEETSMTVAERRQLDFNRDAKRRQSAGLAGLSSKSKVTNSPFLQSPSPSMEEALSPDTNPNFAPSPLESASSVTTGDSPSLASATSFSSPPRSPESNPPAMQMASPAPVTPTKPSSTKSHLSELAKQEAPPTPSPKSSLKTRRLRGPRLSKDLEGGVPLAKRERRKTVTFTERPEVSFFEKDTSAEMSEQDTGGDGEEEDSPDEYGGYEYEYEAGKGSPPSRTAEMGREESGAFEFEDGEAIPSPLPSSQDYDDRRGRFEGGSSNSLAIPVDDSYNDFTLHDRSSDDVYCATDNFVSSLVEDDFLSPVSVSSPIFLGPAVDLDDPDAPIPTAQLPPHPLASELPPLQQPDLPKQPSSETEPILMNGNVLEPSTHLHLANASSSSPVRTTRRSLSPSTSPASSSLTTRSLSSDRPDAHAHQSGPLPDPFLTVSTVQRLFSPPSKPKAAGGLGLGLPADEDGIPYGRSHHAERQQAVKALRRGELTEAEGKGSEEAAERTEKEDEDAQERSEELQRSSLVASRGLRLPDVDVFGETKMVRQIEQEREVENERSSYREEPMSIQEAVVDESEPPSPSPSPSPLPSLDEISPSFPLDDSNNSSPDPSTLPVAPVEAEASSAPAFIPASPAMSSLSISASSGPPASASHLDAPWQLPSFTSSSSPLFGMPASPAIPSLHEFGGSFKPSTSAERLRGEGSEAGGSIGSSGGRSPRLTKESIRRKMELKKLEQQRERDRAAGILVDEHIPPLDEWRPNAGLGIGMSSNVQEKGQPAASRPKEGLSASRSSSPTKERVDKALPPPPSSFDPDRSSQAMSRPKGITSDVAPSSIFSHQDQRPSLRPRANTLSAQDILSTESALERLALGPSQTSLHEGVIKNGSGKAVQVEQKRIISSDYVPSSSPIESGFDHGSHDFPPRPSSTQSSSQLPLAAQTRAQQASPPVEASALSSTSAAAEKARRDAELMPPPPLPSSRPTHLRQPSDTLLPPRSTSPTPSGYSSSGNEGPKGREDAINARKREKRAEAGGEPVKKEKKARGRARRSLSTGDSSLLELEDSATKTRTAYTPDTSALGKKLADPTFTQDMSEALDKIVDHKDRKYRLVEREQVYVASDEKVRHDGHAGDLDRGRAWRAVKRPSDMNEYADEIRAIHSREKPGRAHAKVFVKIVSITEVAVPLPTEAQTNFRIALNNGLHSVETASYRLGQNVDIGQEFELLGLENLEFSLSIKVKSDPHILTRQKNLVPKPTAHLAPPTTSSPSSSPSAQIKKESRFSKLLHSPRRPKAFSSSSSSNAPSTPPPAAAPAAPSREPLRDDLVRYLGPDGTLATVKVVFKTIASKCNGQILTLGLPLSGRWNDESVALASRHPGALSSAGGAAAGGVEGVKRPRTIGRMELQLIMIPSLPGLTPEQLPQSLDDAVTGLRHVHWHKMDYFQGVLTQLGGDCSSWRRRRMRIVGGTLEATSDVTARITARIDLSKMIAVHDENANLPPTTTSTSSSAMVPQMSSSSGKRSMDDDDRPMSVERSFRLVFEDGEEISFYADSDEEKSDWLHHLNELLGRVPDLPFWAEMLWVRQQAAAAQQAQHKSA